MAFTSKQRAIVTLQTLLVSNVDRLLSAQTSIAAMYQELQNEEAIMAAYVKSSQTNAGLLVRKKPVYYIKNRSQHWKDTVFMTYDNDEYGACVWFSKDNFNYLVSLLQENLQTFTPCCFSGIPNRVMEPVMEPCNGTV